MRNDVAASLRARIRSLRASENGLAMIEFALALPLLFTLVMCGLELANMALTNLKINQMAMLVADNAARVRTNIGESDINSLLYGARSTGDSIQFGANGRIILSDVELNAAGNGQWIRWQRCVGAKQVTSPFTAGQGKTNASLQYVGTATNQLKATAGNPIMYVEVYYDYQPLVLNSLFGPRTVVWRAAFNIRDRTTFDVQADGDTASSCSTYSAT